MSLAATCPTTYVRAARRFSATAARAPSTATPSPHHDLCPRPDAPDGEGQGLRPRSRPKPLPSSRRCSGASTTPAAAFASRPMRLLPSVPVAPARPSAKRSRRLRTRVSCHGSTGSRASGSAAKTCSAILAPAGASSGSATPTTSLTPRARLPVVFLLSPIFRQEPRFKSYPLLEPTPPLPHSTPTPP